MSGIAAARVQRFLDEHHDVGVRVPVEPFTVDLDGKPREVVALERRIDGRDHVVVFHVFRADPGTDHHHHGRVTSMDAPEMNRCPRCYRGIDTCKAAGDCGDLVIGNHVDEALRPLYGAVANVETRTGERVRIEVTLPPRVYHALAITMLRRGSGPPPPSFEYAPGVVVRRGDR